MVAEIYPSMLTAKPESGETPDRAQVRALCEHFAKLDDQTKLGELFARPKAATDEDAAVVEREEGWILGA